MWALWSLSRMKILISIFLLITAFSVHADQEIFLLTENSIDEMKIQKGMAISLYKIKRAFPFYRVTHEIAEGDSPDYHRFTVSNHDGEELIYFHSYIDDEKEYESGVVKLDEVISCSKYVLSLDRIGPTMQVGSIPDVEALEFGVGHMDNYLGDGSVWYLFSVGYLHGTQVSKVKALESNPKIQCISWPAPWWS